MNWSVRDLQVFLVLAETLSFRRAAEITSLSQPAVSGILSRLEDMTRVRLMDRSTRSVRLTDAGLLLQRQAQVVCFQLVETESALKALTQLNAGKVRIAALPSLAAAVVPAAFAAFKAEHPLVKLEVIDALSQEALDLVRAERVDFALTAEQAQPDELEYRPISSDRFVLLIPESHPLAAEAGPVSWLSTLAYPHITMSNPTSVRRYVESAFLTLNQRFCPTYEVSHLATLSSLVSVGLGVSALPKLAAQVAPKGNTVQRPLIEPELWRSIGVVTRRGRSLSIAAAAMVEQMSTILTLLTQTTPP